MSDLTDRINSQIRYCQGRIERATFKLEHDEWRAVLRLLEDIRDQLGRPEPIPQTAIALAVEAAVKRGPGRPRKDSANTSTITTS